MARSQLKSKRKKTGGKYIASRKKRLNELGGNPTLTKLADRHVKPVRILGGSSKFRLLAENFANVADPSTKHPKKVKIKSVTENLANRNFVRRNILTKGTIIDTELGKARVTSRPGQEGTVNAVLITK
jgi:small subunit ribosomal protein S8e